MTEAIKIVRRIYSLPDVPLDVLRADLEATQAEMQSRRLAVEMEERWGRVVARTLDPSGTTVEWRKRPAWGAPEAAQPRSSPFLLSPDELCR